MPGLFGGLTAIVVVPGITQAQLTGMAVTLVLALVAGIISGYLIKAYGVKILAYED